MKTFQLIMLAVFGLAALIGLAVFATQKSGSATALGPVLIWGLLPQEALDATLAEMSAENKGFASVTYIEKEPDTFGSELAQAIAEGSGPDLVIITQEELVSERAKLAVIPFATISERTFVDSYVPISELFLTEGGMYGVPLAVDPLMLYYNRARLFAAGIAAPPASWEAVSSLAEQFSEVTAAGAVVRSVIPFGDYANIDNARAIVSAIFFQAGIPITEVEQGRVSAALLGSGEEGRMAASAALSFYAQFADPAKTVYSWNRALQNSRALFLQGDLLLYPGFASERAFLSAANPNLDFDMAPLPQPSVAAERSTFGRVYAAALPRASMNSSGAVAVAVALSRPEESAYLASLSSMASAHARMLGAPPDDKFAAVFYPEALRARGWLSPAPSVTDGIFAGMIGNVTTGRQSVTESLEAAHESLDAALP